MSTKQKDVDKKNFKKGKGMRYHRVNQGAIIDGINDWQWYADDANLLKDATNLSFNNAVGGYLVDETTSSSSDNDNSTIPGIMSMVYVPTVGISKDFNSPINVAKAKLYTFVRHANSGHSNYDAPDLMQYVMSKTSVDAIWWHFARVYACAFKYHQTNRYLPKALIEAMDIDADDIIANLADFRATLNIAAVKLNALFIPNKFGYYKRQTWLNSNVFLDSASPKSQIYIPIPYCAWKYNETGADVGNLTPEVVYNPVQSKLTYANIVTLLNNLINPLVASEDINIMSGDMLKAYGEDLRVTLPTLPETYAIEFMYSEEVLEQIHNTTFVGEFFDGYTPKIIQNPSTGEITFDPLLNADNYSVDSNGTIIISKSSRYTHIEDDKRFDLITNDASPERIIVASRNTVMYAPLSSAPTTTPSHVDSCGSELFLYGDIYVNTYKTENITNKGLARYRLKYINTWFASKNEVIYSMLITEFTKFDWAPICYFFMNYVDQSKGDVEFGCLYDPNDINNYTVIHKSNLAKLHELALLTQLDVTKK